MIGFKDHLTQIYQRGMLLLILSPQTRIPSTNASK